MRYGTSVRGLPKNGRATGKGPVVQNVAPAKTKHGKKRRSVQKKHDVHVLQELRAHPEESPQEAAEKVRSSTERPPAPVIDVRDAARRRVAKHDVPASGYPNASPKDVGLMSYLRNAAGVGERIWELAGELVRAPRTVLKLVRAMRHREA